MQIQKGACGARADDTKGMKGAIVDWITPKGQSLNPHIPCNVKVGRGFNHERTGALLCLQGLTGTMSSMYRFLFSGSGSTLRIEEQRPNSAMGKCKSGAINGLSFCTQTILTTLTIHGTDYSAVVFLCR